jgi:hypothetical protein
MGVMEIPKNDGKRHGWTAANHDGRASETGFDCACRGTTIAGLIVAVIALLVGISRQDDPIATT